MSNVCRKIQLCLLRFTCAALGIGDNPPSKSISFFSHQQWRRRKADTYHINLTRSYPVSYKVDDWMIMLVYALLLTHGDALKTQRARGTASNVEILFKLFGR